VANFFSLQLSYKKNMAALVLRFSIEGVKCGETECIETEQTCLTSR